jgi:hypothetical protein
MSKLRLLVLGGASLIAPGVMLIQLSRRTPSTCRS